MPKHPKPKTREKATSPWPPTIVQSLAVIVAAIIGSFILVFFQRESGAINATPTLILPYQVELTPGTPLTRLPQNQTPLATQTRQDISPSLTPTPILTNDDSLRRVTPTVSPSLTRNLFGTTATPKPTEIKQNGLQEQREPKGPAGPSSHVE